jgi:hypothetical protein
MFERHFIAYGVRMGLRADCRTLLDALKQDPVPRHLPFGWRAVEDDEPDAPVSIRYELLTCVSEGAGPSFRVYAGTNLLAEVHTLKDVASALGRTRGAFRRGTRAGSPLRTRWYFGTTQRRYLRRHGTGRGPDFGLARQDVAHLAPIHDDDTGQPLSSAPSKLPAPPVTESTHLRDGAYVCLPITHAKLH